MKLYEPITFLLASILILAVWGEMFVVFKAERQADCYKRNAEFIDSGAEGPRQEC